MYIMTKYTRVGRAVYSSIKDGKIVVNDDGKGKSYSGREKEQTTYTIQNNDVVGYTSKWTEAGVPFREEVIYGSHRKMWKKGKEVICEKYRPGSNQAKINHGVWKATKMKLNDKYDGTLKQLCYGGSFRREIFIYKNRKEAYNLTPSRRTIEVKYPNGKPWLTITLGEKEKLQFGYRNFFLGESGKPGEKTDHSPEPKDWDYTSVAGRSVRNYTVEVLDPTGKVKCKGKVENGQKIGEWIEDFENKYYLLGAPVSKKMFFAKPEDLDPKEVLQIENVQLRTAYISKIGTERILKEVGGDVVHKDGDCELYKVPMRKFKPKGEWRDSDENLMLLKVKCPSTGTFYTLRVPPGMATCEQARRWTMRLENNDAKILEET